MKIKKRSLLFLGLLLFSVVMISAAWFMTLQTTGNYAITSTEPELGFTTFFLGAQIDTSDEVQIFEDTAKISNPGDAVWVKENIEIIKTDVNDTCEDYLDDCSLNFQIGFISTSNLINFTDGDYNKLLSGDSRIVSTLTCKRYSCPQNISARVSLTPDYDYLP